MNTYSLLRRTKSTFEGMKLQVRYKKWSMFNKLPTMSPTPDPLEIEDKPVKNSGSSYVMKAYLERVQNYNKFMTEERTVYEIGKRHLANMMGRDPETFTQEDIDESIEYLFPTSLYKRGARPMMKPPEQIFPPKKEAEFDETGRPFHFLFYTTRPCFYQAMHDAAKILRDLNAYEDKIIRGEKTNDGNYSAFSLENVVWIKKETLEKKYQEFLHENEYNQMKLVLDRIASHPYGSKYSNFVYQFCSELTEKHDQYEADKPEVLEDGRQRLFFPFVKKKSVVASVSVTYPGTGLLLIDGQDLRFFSETQARSAILFPLVFSNMLKKVDIEAWTVQKPEVGGDSALAVAIRTGISRGLFHFVDGVTKDKMKLAGLLQPDLRRKERKKPGQEGARRKFTWRKR